MVLASPPLFVYQVVNLIDLVLLVLCVLVEVYAFVHCLRQRADAFAAIGTLPKGGWLAINGGAVLVTAIAFGPTSMLGLIGIAAAGVYLLDVRPALRDIANGHGSW